MKTRFYPEISEKVYYDYLPGGLPIYILPRQGYQKKHALLAVRCGGGDRFIGQDSYSPAGTAHYIEHKMFDIPKKNLLSAFSSLGADVNAFTGSDITGYHFTCTERFEECLVLLLKMVLTPYFTEESVEKERGIITQEIRMIADRPRTAAYYQMVGALYPGHPAFESVAGSVESISAIYPNTLYAYYNTYYRPSNMALCVVGDVDPERVFLTSARLLSSVKSEPVKRCYPVLNEDFASCSYFTNEMDISFPEFCMGFRSQPKSSGSEGLKYDLISECAVRILFAQSSDLYQTLYQSGLIGTDFIGSAETSFNKCFILLQGKSNDPEQIIDIVQKSLLHISEQNISADLMRQKKAVAGSYLYRLSGFNSAARMIVNGVFSGFDSLKFSTVLDEISETDILEYINSLNVSGSVMSAVLPKNRS